MSDWAVYLNFVLVGFSLALGLWQWDRTPVKEVGWLGHLRAQSLILVVASLAVATITIHLIHG